MVKVPVDFELEKSLEKTAEETLDEIIEQLFMRMRNGDVKEIQALAKAIKDIAIARTILNREAILD